MKKALFRQLYSVDEEKEIKVVNSKVEKIEEEPIEEVKEVKREEKKKNGRKFNF